MKYLLPLVLLLAAKFAFAVAKKYDSEENLRLGLESDAVYFLPQNKDDVTSWSGHIYEYETKNCFLIEQNQKNDTIQSSETKCPQALTNIATEKYDLISDFDKFKQKFLGCLHEQDQICLRRLTSKKIQISFGVDGYGDRRAKLYPSWKKKDYEKMIGLIKKGVSPSGENRDFPHPQVDDYIGMRGAFEKEQGGWLLKYYLGGD